MKRSVQFPTWLELYGAIQVAGPKHLDKRDFTELSNS